MEGDIGRYDCFAEKSFFEYHLYISGPPGRPSSKTQQKQQRLFQMARAACEKTLVYHGQAGQSFGVYGAR